MAGNRAGGHGAGNAHRAGEDRKTGCPDCFHCQGCSEDRCRQCLKHGHSAPATLARGFTYGEYLEWKKRQPIPAPSGAGRP